MKHVSILLPVGESVLGSIVGSFKIFNNINTFLIESRKTDHDYFNIELVGLKESTELYNGKFTLRPTKTIDQVDKIDLIIITGDIARELKDNNAFIPWIREQRIKIM